MDNIYRNLFDTWGLLAPDELVVKEGGQYDLLKLEDLFQCILDRPDWNLMLVSGDCDNERLWDATVWVDAQEFLVEGKSLPTAALLTAYLTALAAQRSPNSGQWLHFKGDTVVVLGIFPFGTRDCADGDFTEEGLFTFEDDLTLSFQLLCWGDGHMEFQHTALSLGFLPDRVAYLHDGKGYLRTPENFLSLVGYEHPEHEGKLRFTEVPNA